MSTACSSTALYARVSSEQQAQAGTIASQISALQERIVQDGFAVTGELSFVDEGYSGATLIRPALERLRDAVANGAVDRVYVHSPDRLARKYAYQVLLVDELRRAGVEIVFLNHRLGQSPEEDMLLQMQGMMAEYERAKILERSRRGKLHAARRGVVNVLSGAPYGYRYVGAQDGAGRAAYEVVLEHAHIIRQIFEWVGRERCSIGEVCRRLKAQGTPSPRGNIYWDRTSVWGILKNPAYKGMAAFGKTRVGAHKPALRPLRGKAEQPRRAHSVNDTPIEQWQYIPVPALIEESLFAAVQAQLIENRQRHRQHARGNRHLLQGLLVCKQCEYAYYGKPVSRSAAKGKLRHYCYYRCTGSDAYRFGGQRVCHNKQLRSDLLDAAVWEDVKSLLKHPERIAQEHQRRLTNSEKNADLERLQQTIGKTKSGIARLVDAYSDGLLERAEFEPRLLRARERLAKLEVERDAEHQRTAQLHELRLVVGRLEDFAAQVTATTSETPWSTRRDIIRALVKRIEVDKEAVRVVYRISPLPFAEAPNRGPSASLQHCWRGDFAAVGEHLLSALPGRLGTTRLRAAVPLASGELCGRLRDPHPRARAAGLDCGARHPGEHRSDSERGENTDLSGLG